MLPAAVNCPQMHRLTRAHIYNHMIFAIPFFYPLFNPWMLLIKCNILVSAARNYDTHNMKTSINIEKLNRKMEKSVEEGDQLIHNISISTTNVS